METEINNKTKAPEESIDDTLTKKVRFTDPLELLTPENIGQNLGEWIDACDPLLREQSFGWGGPKVVANYIKNTDKMKSAWDYYKEKNIAILESDKALCEQICDIHIFHIIAKEWSARPDICYGSYEQQVMLYVIKHNLLLHKKDCLEKFVHRLLVLSYEYEHKYDFERDGEDENGKAIYKKKEPVLKEIPLNQQASFAIFFYPNLQFLWKKENETRYSLACEDIKRGVDSFCEVLKQVEPNLPVCGCNGFGCSLEFAAKKAIDNALKVYYEALPSSYSAINFRLKFNKKPLSITQETAYTVNF